MTLEDLIALMAAHGYTEYEIEGDQSEVILAFMQDNEYGLLEIEARGKTLQEAVVAAEKDWIAKRDKR